MKKLEPSNDFKRSPGRTGRIRYNWWRAHHGLPSHPKWRSVARAADVHISTVVHIVLCLLDAASQHEIRGSIEGVKLFDLAAIVDSSEDEIGRVIVMLREIHWLEGHMVAQWDERQPLREDDGAAKRAQEYRDRKKGFNGERHAASRRVTRDHAPSHEITQPSCGVTTANAPDRDKDKKETYELGAHIPPVDNVDNSRVVPINDNGAGERASAPLTGALARQGERRAYSPKFAFTPEELKTPDPPTGDEAAWQGLQIEPLLPNPLTPKQKFDKAADTLLSLFRGDEKDTLQ